MKKIKQKLAAREVVTMFNPDFTSPRLVEFVGGLGLDVALIDAERMSYDFERVEEMVRAAHVAGIAHAAALAELGEIDLPDDAPVEAWVEQGVAMMLGRIRTSLERMRVEFDLWTSERGLHESGAVAAAALLRAGRPGLAGAATGIGFLYHPMVLLWTPWLALACAASSPRTPKAIAASVTRLAGATAVVVLPWMLLGAVMPHLPETPFAGQGGFLRYWFLADSNLADADAWLRSRWMNFANTLKV